MWCLVYLLLFIFNYKYIYNERTKTKDVYSRPSGRFIQVNDGGEAKGRSVQFNFGVDMPN